jgi:hypothetical protein
MNDVAASALGKVKFMAVSFPILVSEWIGLLGFFHF